MTIKITKLVATVFLVSIVTLLIEPKLTANVTGSNNTFENKGITEQNKAKVKTFADSFCKQAKAIAVNNPNASAKDFDKLFEKSFDFDAISDYILTAALGKSFKSVTPSQQTTLKKLCIEKNKRFYLNKDIIQKFRKSDIKIQRVTQTGDNKFKVMLKIILPEDNSFDSSLKTYMEVEEKNNNLTIVNLVVFSVDLRQAIIADLKDLFKNKSKGDIDSFIKRLSE